MVRDKGLQFEDVLSLAERFLKNVDRQDLAQELTRDLFADIEWMYQLDPASKEKDEILKRSTTAAIACYRIANLFHRQLQNDEIAHQFYSYLKTLGVDIHYGATIGVPFALDHGIGTVIGETAEIGSRCMMLHNVTLGAARIGQKAGEHLRGVKRHPTIGDNVSIGNDVEILGPVIVGSNSRIGDHCLITNDIPQDSVVRCIARMQIVNVNVDLLIPAPFITSVNPCSVKVGEDIVIDIHGNGFEYSSIVELVREVKVVDKQRCYRSVITTVHPSEYVGLTPNRISVKFDGKALAIGEWSIRVINTNCQVFTLMCSILCS